MHVRAYNYWVSLLDGRDFPSIEDLEPGDVEDFAAAQRAARFHLRRATIRRFRTSAPTIRDECGLDDDTRTISDVPSRSLLSRLTDHYMQIIANRAPIGFEAEFVNQREREHLLSRHPDALLLRRRRDRFHLRRHQLEDASSEAADPARSLRPRSDDEPRRD